MPDDLRCPVCRNYRDTPMHEHGCPAGGQPQPQPATTLDGLLADPGDPTARMDAYYYSFERTGVALVDRILSAVATAGKRAHHTESWQDDNWWVHGSAFGVSPRNLIQQAAQQAADELRAAGGSGLDVPAWADGWSLDELAGDLASTCTSTVADLRHRREEMGVPLEVMADRMATDPAVIERELERYDGDPTLSMLRRYALAVHARLEIKVVPVDVEPVEGEPLP